MTWPTTWIVETLVASALLIAAVLILRRPAARLFGPHAAYLLWAIPALRLLLPPIPEAAIVPVAPAEAPVLASFPAADLIAPPGMTPTLQHAVALAPDVDWGIVLFALWLAGAAIHMTWHVVSYRRFLSGAVGAGAPAHRLDGILVHNADVAGPAAAGVIRRRILVPYDFVDRFERRERRLALAHEVAHHRRGDLLANWAALVVLSLHWFNLLAHIAYRAFRADQELACDATVLRAASETERHAYASAVVKAAWVKSPVAACPMNGARHLKVRLAMMRGGGIHRPLVGLLTVAVVAAAALGATASRITDAPTQASAAPVAPAAPDRLSETPAIPTVIAPDPAPTMATTAASDRQVLKVAQARPDPSPLAVAPADVHTALPAPVLHAVQVEDRPGPVVHAETSVTALVPAIMASPENHRGADRQPAAATPASFAAMPPPGVLKASAAVARKEMEYLSKGILAVREVRAVIVDGQFNAADPGAPFVGFCGYALLAGERNWLPFFVSATPSKPGRSAKCAAPQSAEDYSRDFQPTRAKVAATRSSKRYGCTADQGACRLPIYAGLSALGYSAEFNYGASALMR